jgi:hypothetical protein
MIKISMQINSINDNLIVNLTYTLYIIKTLINK